MATQQRARLIETGWDRDLEYEELEIELPTPGADEVLVEVGACGVAYRDLIDRAGRLPFLMTPIVQGHEVAGRIIAAGDEVSVWKKGDHVGTLHRDSCGSCERCEVGETSLCLNAGRVFGITIDGGYQRYMTAPARALYRVPASMKPAHAAVLNSTFGTAYRALNRFGGLKAGQRVIITGANGGVGIGGVQIAKRMGCEVAGVVRRPELAEFVLAAGADHVIVDEGGGFHKKLPFGAADVVLDCVGQPTFNASLRAAVIGGGLAVVGNVSDKRAEVNLGSIVVRDIRIVGSTGATPTDLARLLALHEAQPFEFFVDEEVPLREADAAQRRVLAGGIRGRLVLVPQT